MEVAEAEVYASEDPLPEPMVEPEKEGGGVRRWRKEWVPQDTVIGSGTCFLFKWVTEDVLNLLQAKRPVVVEQQPEDEHEVVFLCTYEGCGKIFPEASGLRKHAHVHGEKQYICQYEGCGKRFVDSSKLKRHFLIHTGEKHFMCPFEGCGKAFSLDFNLRSHMRTHTGENYHICPYEDCGKRYAHEYKLKAHMRSFHDKNIPDMPTATSPLPDLEKDVMIPKYTPPAPVAPPPPAVVEKPFVCPLEGCPKRYIHEYKLNLHLKNAHPHLLNGDADEGFRQQQGRSAVAVGAVVNQGQGQGHGGGAGGGGDEIEEDSDHDFFQDGGHRSYEQQLPGNSAAEPTSRRRAGGGGGTKAASGKGPLQLIAKPPQQPVPVPKSSSSTKRKRANPPPPPSIEPTLKLHVKHSGSAPRGSGGVHPRQQELMKAELVVAEDSEETEDEDRDNTEEEDNVQHIGGGGGGGRMAHQHMGHMEEDDEETEDDMD